MFEHWAVDLCEDFPVDVNDVVRRDSENAVVKGGVMKALKAGECGQPKPILLERAECHGSLCQTAHLSYRHWRNLEPSGNDRKTLWQSASTASKTGCATSASRDRHLSRCVRA